MADPFKHSLHHPPSYRGTPGFPEETIKEEPEDSPSPPPSPPPSPSQPPWSCLPPLTLSLLPQHLAHLLPNTSFSTSELHSHPSFPSFPLLPSSPLPSLAGLSLPWEEKRSPKKLRTTFTGRQVGQVRQGGQGYCLVDYEAF